MHDELLSNRRSFINIAKAHVADEARSRGKVLKSSKSKKTWIECQYTISAEGVHMLLLTQQCHEVRGSYLTRTQTLTYTHILTLVHVSYVSNVSV